MTRAVRSVLVAVLAAACISSGAVPAQASVVTVTVEVSHIVHRPGTDLACEVAVPEGSNGIAVLDAAVQAGCITSYETAEFEGFGRYITCVDGLCQVAGGLVAYWALFFDDEFAQTGIEGFEAAVGREIELTFTSLNCWVELC